MPGWQRARITSPVAIDREPELAVIENAIELALQGTPRSLLVAGEAGIGKTRLVEEATRRAVDRGMRALSGGCLELGGQVPYLPFVQMLRTLLHDASPASREAFLAPAREQLALLVPEIAGKRHPGRDAAGAASGGTRDAPGPILPGADHELRRLVLFEGLLGVAERLVAETPTVVVVEDLQWADRSTLDLLGYLRNGLRRGHLLVILTVRAEEAQGPALAFLAELERGEPIERIDLAGFDHEETARQVAAILGHAPDPGLVASLWELGAGNPFYTEELLVLAGPSSDVVDPTSPPPARPMAIPAIPPRLRDVLRARTAPLDSDARAVLRTAAIAGRSVDGRLLARASGLEPTRLERALRSVLDAHLLVAVPDDQGRAFRFRHEVMRAHIASQVLPSEAARLHEALARALEADPEGTFASGELALHWDAAGEPVKAFVAHVDAGLEAERAFAFEEASGHLTRALELWDRIPDPEGMASLDRPRLVQRAADAAARSGHLDRAIELARAILAADPPDDVELVESMRSRLRWYLWQDGRSDEAALEAERAAIALSDPGSTRWRANALVHLAGVRLMSGDHVAARRSAVRAMGLATSAGAHDEEAMARGIVGWSLIAGGRPVEGVGLIRAVWKATLESPDAPLTGIALAYEQLAAASEVAGRVHEAAEVARDGAAWAARHGLERTSGVAMRTLHARALYHLGRWDEAERIVAATPDGVSTGADAFGILVVRTLLAVGQGRRDEADEASRIAALGRPSSAALQSVGWSAAAVAEQALWDRDPLGALAALGLATGARTPRDQAAPEGGPGPARTTGIDPVIDASVARRLALAARALADLAGLDGRTAEAAGSSIADLPAVTERRLSGQRGRSLAAAWGAWVSIARAELVRARRGPAPTQARPWRRAAGIAAERRDPYAEAYSRWRLAEAMLAGRVQRGPAAAELRAALALARRLDAGPLITELELLARRARVNLEHHEATVAEPKTESIPFDLTPRELEVLRLLALGDSNREIGAKLYISPRTAGVHVSNILGKLGVKGRVEAATLAQRVGLEPPRGRAVR